MHYIGQILKAELVCHTDKDVAYDRSASFVECVSSKSDVILVYLISMVLCVLQSQCFGNVTRVYTGSLVHPFESAILTATTTNT